MGWKRLRVTNTRNSHAQRQQLIKLYALLKQKLHNVPHGLCVYCLHDEVINTVSWYFSPEAAELANHFGAVPCEKPAAVDGLEVLVGDLACTEIHFPSALPQSR